MLIIRSPPSSTSKPTWIGSTAPPWSNGSPAASSLRHPVAPVTLAQGGPMRFNVYHIMQVDELAPRLLTGAAS